MAYANTNDLSKYLGVSETEFSNDIDRLLENASDLIDYFTLNRIDISVDLHLSNAKDATCAQVEYWMQIDESMDIVGSPKRMVIDSFTYDGKLAELAPRAKRKLLRAGLLYSGVGMR